MTNHERGPGPAVGDAERTPPRRQLEAIDDVYAMEPVPGPADWAEWEREYSRLKTRKHGLDPLATDGR